MSTQQVEEELGSGESHAETVTSEQAAAVADTAGATVEEKAPEPAPSPVMTTVSLGTPTINNGDGSWSDPKDAA